MLDKNGSSVGGLFTCRNFLIVWGLFAAWSFAFFPAFYIYPIMLIDYLTPWKVFDSFAYNRYHEFLVSRLPERPELPLLEINPDQLGSDPQETIARLSQGYTEPIVIRNWVKDSEGVKRWGHKDFWTGNYGDEEVLCGGIKNSSEKCTINMFFANLESGKDSFYISGASNIFDNNKELHDMVDTPAIKAAAPKNSLYMATQMFLGVPGMGSHIHTAMGVNIFRQIQGRKKWYFIPSSQTSYLKPSINTNGFSCHTKTLIDLKYPEPAEQSAWFGKLERYSITLNPGDVLYNPPWYWHGVINFPAEGQDSEHSINIGVPSRYRKGDTIMAAFRVNFVLTCVTYATLIHRLGFAWMDPNWRLQLQNQIAGNRAERAEQFGNGHDDNDLSV